MSTIRRWSLAIAALTITAAACGMAAAEQEPTDTGSDPATTMAHDMAMMDMGDAALPPAHERAEADLATGAFASLPGVTPEDITGTAWLARHSEGTTVTLELDGLEPSTDHIAHVHERPCAEAGGAHYRYDTDGMPHPPNEIHLAFTTDAAGAGTMTVDNDRVATADAVSVVVHTAADGASKLACADLTG